MKRFQFQHLALSLALGAAAFPHPAGAAEPPRPAEPQRGAWTWPEHPKNLRVLPKKTSGETLRSVMTGFTRALGVRCSHCHVGVEGQPLSTYDFPSDKNPKKQVARGMYKMLGSVNKDLVKIQPDKKDRVNMWCHTCHRGRPVPMTLAEELTRTYTSAGTDSALAQYRTLRSRFLEAGAYDFREGSLIELAELALSRHDPAGAIAILQVNAEHFPESGRVHESLGGAYLAAGDTARAVTSYEKALSLEPRNQRVEQILKSLRRNR